MSDGIILYEGPSLLDGAPIVAIATGIANKSKNSKTGAMVQTWILRGDVHPIDALRSGQDASICGDCRHRGDHGKARTCYVNMMGPSQVWKAYKAGGYQSLSAATTPLAFSGRTVRLGSYGDPAAIPVRHWTNALRYAKVWTGYTHAWRRFSELNGLCMASVDTEQEAQEAQLKGWRTFRIRGSRDPLMPGEVVCPASQEAGKKTTCELCRACGGNSSKARAPIAIVAHGQGARNFERQDR